MKEFTIKLTEEEMNIIEKSMRVAMSSVTTPSYKMSEEEHEEQVKCLALWMKLKGEIDK